MRIDAVLRELAAGSDTGPIALVTLAAVSGSTPREAGSRMIVRKDGSTLGTVGGGKGEAKARETALACLASGRNAHFRFEMTSSEAKGPDVICGGVADFWIEVVKDRKLYAQAVSAIDGGHSVLIACGADEGSLALLSREGATLALAKRDAMPRLDAELALKAFESGLCVLGEGLLYLPFEPLERLLILGGGHVGLALARAALSLDFAITIVDPRPEYSDPGRFPAGTVCRREDFSQAIAAFPSGPSSYVVVVSPGHLGDLDCARELLGGEYRYVGVIGSRRKSRMLIEALVAEGFDRDKVEALRMPIGLDIGAQTPEEIAIAILAEIIAVRHEAPAIVGIDEDRKQRRLPRS
jgi:xanthine dehydrogenase accessory factor